MEAVTVRSETASDWPSIRRLNEAAFGTSEEADLVEALRRDGAVVSSLIAEVDGRIVGHILFSRMFIAGAAERTSAVALAPMAVAPAFQRQGIGSALVRRGLGSLRESSERIVIVVGHAAYYPRFGFSRERAARLEHPFPPNVFMALELQPGALDGVRGRVEYPAAFAISF